MFYGTIFLSSPAVGCWKNVQWDNGQKNKYRMGVENCYDLQLSTGNFSDV